MARLKFSQSLRDCSHAELLKRTRALHKELEALDQDLVETDSLTAIAKELIRPALLLHKEQGVKAYVACALADILRLYAPEAPYTGSELKDIFQFLFRQLKHLTTAQEPHFSEYLFLLDSFANVKSTTLICELNDADELMADFFKQAFGMISSDSPKNVSLFLSDILGQLLEESSTITDDVVNILLAQFQLKNQKKKPAAYELATEVCRNSSDKLQRHVCQYFADVITTSLSGSNSSDEEERPKPKSGKKDKDVGLTEEFQLAHQLVQQINRSVPELLLNVIPLLEQELSAEQPEYRLLATETLGGMFGEKIGQGDLGKKYPQTWKKWTSRNVDKYVKVRIAVAEALGTIWKEHPELGEEIEATIDRSVNDLDEKVRIAACTVYLEMEFETACHATSVEALKNLGERTKDKKANVRAVAFEALGRLYHLAFPQIESRLQLCIDHFAWIPETMLRTMLAEPTSQAAIRSLVKATFHTQLLPPPSQKDEDDIAPYVERLLVIMQHMSEDSIRVLFNLTGLWDRKPGAFEFFIDACEKNNGGVIDGDEALVEAVTGQLKNVINGISKAMPDPAKASDDLRKFAKANEKQLYKLLRTVLDPQSDLKLVLKTQKECLRRLELISSSIVETFTEIIRHGSYQILNKSCIPVLLKKIQLANTTSSEHEATLKLVASVLNFITKSRATLYKSHVPALTKALGAGEGSDVVIEVSLHALSRLVKLDKTTVPDKKLSERAMYYAKEGTPIQAKYAATIVAHDTARPGATDDLVAHLASALPTASSAELVSHIAALGRLARFAPTAFETRSEEITTFLLGQVVSKATDPDDMDDDAEWLDDEELDDLTRSRVLAIKTLVNRCIAYAGEATELVKQQSEPVFRLLWSLLKKREENVKYSAAVASRLRLASALSILKLATLGPVFEVQVFVKFSWLAWTAQDACFEVRSQFIRRLLAYLRTSRLRGDRFNIVLFLVAHDPEIEVIAETRKYVRSRASLLPPVNRRQQFEVPFLRLLHLLAHHPDFTHEDIEEEVKNQAKYIYLYLECLATAENVPFLYLLAGHIKSIRDLESDRHSNNLYILSELSQYIIQAKAKAGGWPLPALPMTLKFPSDIFGKLPDAVTAAEIKKKTYLPQLALEGLELGGKSKGKAMKVKSERKPATTPKKRRSTGTTKSTNKRAKKSWSSSGEEDAESSSADETEESIDEDGETKGDKEKKKSRKASIPSKRAGLRGNGAGKEEKENKKVGTPVGKNAKSTPPSSLTGKNSSVVKKVVGKKAAPAKVKSSPVASPPVKPKPRAKRRVVASPEPDEDMD